MQMQLQLAPGMPEGHVPAGSQLKQIPLAPGNWASSAGGVDARCSSFSRPDVPCNSWLPSEDGASSPVDARVACVSTDS